MSKLTDKQALIAPSDLDLIHVIDVSDTTGSSEGTSKKMALSLTRGTGWASYADDQYIEASPFTINSGVTSSLPNNSAVTIESFLPPLVSGLYDGAKITPESGGSYYSFTVRFCAKSSSVSGSFDFSIDIGGTVGQIFNETKVFSKGANAEQAFSIVAPGFIGETFLANGGTIKIKSLVGNTSIYDISLQIARIHKAG